LNVAVVTTLNEQDSIAPLVAALRCHVDRVVVVDDASDDNTVHNAHHAGAVVMAHTLRIGIGPSLMEGWRLALDSGAALVVQIDAGGSHDPADAGRLMSLLGDAKFGDADMAIGSRFCPGAQYIGNPKRRILSKLAAHMCNVRQVKPQFSDWTSGYRAFTRDAVGVLLPWGNEYKATMHGWQIEVLREAVRRKLTVAEVPITYRAGRSSFNRHIAKEAFRVWATI
jgi:dolichol-phosphate mannosyltransferase